MSTSLEQIIREQEKARSRCDSIRDNQQTLSNFIDGWDAVKFFGLLRFGGNVGLALAFTDAFYSKIISKSLESNSTSNCYNEVAKKAIKELKKELERRRKEQAREKEEKDLKEAIERGIEKFNSVSSEQRFKETYDYVKPANAQQGGTYA